MFLLGDTHGDFKKVADACKMAKQAGQRVISVGDVGIGMPNTFGVKLASNFSFIRGNHDNPDECDRIWEESPNSPYLGNFGMIGSEIFYVSGAHSVDRPNNDIRKSDRVPGIDWWFNEELSPQIMDEALECYKVCKPSIVISHDAPFFLHNALIEAVLIERPQCKVWGGARISRTSNLLDLMFRAHQPKEWYFGHWHISWSYRFPKHNPWPTVFRCLDIGEVLEIQP